MSTKAPDPAARDAWTFFSDAELRERNLRRSFSSIPDVHAFHNELVSGDPSLHYLEYFHSKYIGKGQAIDAVSLGAGNGHLERTLLAFRWTFRSLLGLELNPALVEFARREVAALPGAAAVRYETADLNRLSLPPASADLAIFFHSLHHVEAIEECLAAVSAALRTDGKLLVVDYFGANRLQRSPEHLALCDAFLGRLPERYRVHLERSSPGHIVLKERCENIGREEVARNDPSEAVRSEDIAGCLRRAPALELLEQKPLGGTILDPLLLDIAGNFKPDDEIARAYLRMAMAGEEALLASRALPSDYRFIVLRKRPRRWRRLAALVGRR